MSGLSKVEANYKELAKLREENKALRAAAKPFAAIKPSSFFAPDGSGNEGYVIYLHSPAMGPDEVAFTGKDLARLRSALKAEGGDDAEAR